MSPAERDDILAGFSGGQIAVLTSCALLSEGFDAPDSAVAMLLRPTMSRALYRQQVGRVLRPKADGGRAVVLDYGGNVFRHGLPTMEPRWSLDGKDKTIGEPPVKSCAACGAAMAQSERVCPACGFSPPRPDGEIDEDLTGDAASDRRADDHRGDGRRAPLSRGARLGAHPRAPADHRHGEGLQARLDMAHGPRAWPMKRDLHKLFTTARARGWIVERTRSDHFKLLHPPTGAIIYSSATPSCPRAVRNIEGDIDRAERKLRAGLGVINGDTAP